jgi:dTDP-4-dehydrorhamnose reductase
MARLVTKKILVTGASGQLGQEFVRLSQEIGSNDFVFWSRREGDITRPETLEALRKLNPAILINCAAYTAVDLAQTQVKEAYEVNAEAVQNFAIICDELGIPMIHFSSDYVYHNRIRVPLRESDPTRPKGVYAKSKLKGEQNFLASHRFPIIMRVSWLYSTFGKNFPKTILLLSAQRDHLDVVSDQTGVPTNARDLARAVWQMIGQLKKPTDWKKISGIYNYSNEGTTNWAEIAKYIVSTTDSSCQINPVSSKEFPQLAPRPRYSKLNLSKFKETFKIDIRHWQDSLSDCLIELHTKNQ